MNVRTITSLILAMPWLATAAGVLAAEKSGERMPYTGSDKAVFTTALNLEVTGVGRDTVYVAKDTVSSRPGVARQSIVVNHGWFTQSARPAQSGNVEDM